MRKVSLRFLLALAVAFPLAFLFMRHMESAGRFDSIGLGYTLYVSAIFAVLVAGLATFVHWVFVRLSARRIRASSR